MSVIAAFQRTHLSPFLSIIAQNDNVTYFQFLFSSGYKKPQCIFHFEAPMTFCFGRTSIH